MSFLIYLLFFFLSLGQLQRLSFFDQRVNIYLHETLMIILILIIAARFRQQKKRDNSRELIGKIDNSVIVFLGILLFSLVNGFWKFSFFENAVAALYWLRLALYFLFFTFLENMDSKELKKGLNIFLILTVAFSLVQIFLYSSLRNIYYLGWDPHERRAFGLFFDTTTAGIVYTILFFYSLFNFNIHKKLISFDFFKIVFLLALILLTYSRITYISILVGLVFYYFKKINLKKILIFGVLTFALLLLLPRSGGSSVKLERKFTIVARVVSWREAINIWIKEPILGVGYNRLGHFKKKPKVTNSLTADHSVAAFSSSYFTILASSGILGIGAFLLMLLKFYKAGDHASKTILLVVCVASIFDNVILINFILFFLLLSVGTSLFHKSP